MNLAKTESELDKQNHVLLLHLEIEAGTTFLGEILHLTVIINGLVARLSEVVVVWGIANLSSTSKSSHRRNTLKERCSKSQSFCPYDWITFPEMSPVLEIVCKMTMHKLGITFFLPWVIF